MNRTVVIGLDAMGGPVAGNLHKAGGLSLPFGEVLRAALDQAIAQGYGDDWAVIAELQRPGHA